MARILVIYGTTDGHTARVARFIGDTLREAGHSADVVEADRSAPAPEGYAGVVVAASVHVGGFQRKVHRWLRTHTLALQGRPTAFVPVCLAILQSEPAVRTELNALIERFLTETAFQPTMTRITAGAVLYTQYSWIRRWTMKRIVLKAGGDTDTRRDFVYTDWAEVRAFAEEFSARVMLQALDSRP